MPAFNSFVAQQRLTTTTNDLIERVAYARSEAAKLGGVVSVQALGNDDGNEWLLRDCRQSGSCAGTPLRRIEVPVGVTLDGTWAVQWGVCAELQRAVCWWEV
ncbi:MAG: GspH/FimT family pseudopilin [Pseudomonadales bacterium]